VNFVGIITFPEGYKVKLNRLERPVSQVNGGPESRRATVLKIGG
jgi:hypothetical protein